MASDDSKQPAASTRQKSTRKERLAEALRANLAKRKQQARQRKDAAPGESPTRSGPAGPVTKDQG